MKLSSFILLESSLSFLGLGIQPPDVSLGVMVSAGRDYMINAWWLMDNGYLHRQDRYFVVDSTEKLERIAEGGIDLNRYLGKAISKPSNLQ